MEQTQENKLGVYPIPKLLRSMALPLIVATLLPLCTILWMASMWPICLRWR